MGAKNESLSNTEHSELWLDESKMWIVSEYWANTKQTLNKH